MDMFFYNFGGFFVVVLLLALVGGVITHVVDESQFDRKNEVDLERARIQADGHRDAAAARFTLADQEEAAKVSKMADNEQKLALGQLAKQMRERDDLIVALTEELAKFKAGNVTPIAEPASATPPLDSDPGTISPGFAELGDQGMVEDEQAFAHEGMLELMVPAFSDDADT